MLTFSQIASYFETHLQQHYTRSILREYLQYLILQAIYTSEYGSRLVFLGGTCLRIAYQSGRFSEDLDFDNRGLDEDDWKRMAEMIAIFLRREGLEVENHTIFKGAFHCHIKIPHILFQYGFSEHHDEKILIQIDSVAQGYDYLAIPHTLDLFGISETILVTPREMLLSQKIRAAYERKRTKGRDFYDIRFLLSWGVKPDYGYLGEKMHLHNADELRSFMQEKNAGIDFSQLARDVEPFLFRAEDVKLVRDFSDMVAGMRL